LVWSPLNDNLSKRKGGVSNLGKGSSDLLFVYRGTKQKTHPKMGLWWRWRESNPCLSCSTI